MVAVDTWAGQAGTAAGTAAEGSPVVHTAAVDMAVVGKPAAEHTVAGLGTVAAEDKHRAAVVVDRRLPEEEGKCAEAGENRSALDTEPGLALAGHIQCCTVAAALKLHNENTNKTSIVNGFKKQQVKTHPFI